MKRLTTFLMALMLITLGASAQGSWTAPQPTTRTLTSGNQYYLYNVGAGEFLVNGNDYLTRASVGPQGLVTTVTSTGSGWTIMFASVVGSYVNKTNCYLYYIGEALYCDLDAVSNDSYFTITEISGQTDTYTIVSTSANSTYVGWDEDDGTVVSPMIANVNENTYWQFIIQDDYDVYLAKLDLYDVLVEAEEMGMDSDTNYQNAGTVYTSNTATVDEINAAIEALELAMESHASADHPVDVTNFYITNPSFDTGNLTGWTGFGYQSTPHANGDITISGYAETWSSSTLDNTAFSQTLTLPKGTYRLEADVVATQQDNDDLAVSGVYLCAGSQRTSVHTGNGLPEHFTVEFYVTNENGESADIGMKIYSTDANWVAVDNFVLYYLGEEVTAVTDTESDYKEGGTVTVDGTIYTVQGDNMVENHSFELGFDGWTQANDYATGITFTNFELRSDAQDGKVCLVGTTNAGSSGAGSLGTAWAIESGKTYYFSYWIKQGPDFNEEETTGYYIMTSVTNTKGTDYNVNEGHDSDGAHLLHNFNDGEDPIGTSWQKVEVVYTNGTGDDAYKYLQIDFRWLNNQFAFDNFQLYEIDEDLLPVDWTMTAAGWGTLILPFDADVPDGLTLYAGDALTLEDDGSTLTVGDAAETIAANTPYLVKGTEGTYTFSGTSEEATNGLTAGYLTGTYETLNYEALATIEETSGTVYLLQKHEYHESTEEDEGGVGFYPVTEDSENTGVTLGAYHCYLTLPSGSSGVRAFISLPGDAGDETGIVAVEGDVIANDAIYDLSGRRVAKAVKGVYIMNGKKVLVK